MHENELEISELPKIARWAFWGIIISFGLRGVAGCLLMIAKTFEPAIVAKMGIWFWVMITLIWIPAVFGLVCGYFTIIRYPYLRQVIQVNES